MADVVILCIGCAGESGSRWAKESNELGSRPALKMIMREQIIEHSGAEVMLAGGGHFPFGWIEGQLGWWVLGATTGQRE